MESLLKEYPISKPEGLALMRLAEALLRVPDSATAIALTADQLGRANFDGTGDGMMSRLSNSVIALSKKTLPEAEHPSGLFGKLGAKTVVAATVRAVQLLAKQFVLGQTIEEALAEARSQRKESSYLRFSFDMLGEGARTMEDADRYFASYEHAIENLAQAHAALRKAGGETGHQRVEFRVGPDGVAADDGGFFREAQRRAAQGVGDGLAADNGVHGVSSMLVLMRPKLYLTRGRLAQGSLDLPGFFGTGHAVLREPLIRRNVIPRR